MGQGNYKLVIVSITSFNNKYQFDILKYFDFLVPIPMAVPNYLAKCLIIT